ncbi:MAG: hypothetical protein KTR28_02040 [Micavibrio sp.]|nr:hypothetical protein [Micavibrio sp.]
MKKTFTKSRLGAIMMAGAMTVGSSSAFAAGGGGGGGNNFSTISTNISGSLSQVPGLLSVLAYLMGITLGILGVLKIKDHVENPTQTPLKDGCVRLGIGGALFALPILFESMLNTINAGEEGANAKVAKVNKAVFKF